MFNGPKNERLYYENGGDGESISPIQSYCFIRPEDSMNYSYVVTIRRWSLTFSDPLLYSMI